TDNFSEGNRAQFNPAVAVDPVTGTLYVSYYDARYDASNARVVDSITASIDGGASFSPSTYLNRPKTANDGLDPTRLITVQPIPAKNASGVLTTYNNTFTADGRRKLEAFLVTFDRPIDPTTFTPADIAVQFRDPSGNPFSVSATAVIPEDLGNPGFLPNGGWG